MDDASSPILCDRTKTRILTYGEGRNNDIYPLFFKVEAKQMRLQLHTPVGEMDLLLKLRVNLMFTMLWRLWLLRWQNKLIKNYC